MPSTITCPGCKSVLNLAGGIPPGGKVKCGQCGSYIRITRPSVPTVQAIQPRPRLPVVTPLRAAAPPPQPAPTVMPRRERSVRRPRKQGLSGAAIAGICGGAFLVVGLIVALVIVLVMKRSPDVVVAEQTAVPAAAPAQAQQAFVAPAVVAQPHDEGRFQAKAQPVAADLNQPAIPTVPPPEALDANGMLPFKTLDALKRASVFVRVEAGDELASGSGFLARVEGGAAFVVTNHHVIAPTQDRVIVLKRPGMPRPPGSRLPPRGDTTVIIVAKGFERPTYRLVFNSGTSEEKIITAELAADDVKADLAILRIQNPPPGTAMIPIDAQTPLVETMPVYIFGFPFGEMLSTNKGNPAITVGKGSVSSIRTDNQGQVSIVQINADVNPGNSGGPVVDARGRLVGIAVATVRGTQIGLMIPAAKLPTLLNTAPTQGVVAASPAQPDNLTDPPRPQGGNPPMQQPPGFRLPQPPPGFQFPQQPPALAGKRPLTDAELNVVLQALGSNNFALINNAMVRLSNAEPVDSQREQVINAVKRFTRVTDFTADMYAAKVLGVWGTNDVVPTLLDILKSKNVLARNEALRSLAKFKDTRAAEPIALRLVPMEHRQLASEALKQMGAPAEKAVLPYLKHNDLFVRHEACGVLEVIGTQKSLAPLGVAARDSNGLVRMAAENALAAIKGRKGDPSGTKGADASSNAPAGWKSYSPRDKSFAVNLPNRGGRRSERERTMTIHGNRIKINMVQVDLPTGATFRAGAASLSPQMAQQKSPEECMTMVRDAFAEELKGNIAGDKEIRQGALKGHEYEIAGQATARLRLFADGGHVYYAIALGSNDQIRSADAGTFFDSFKTATATAQAKAGTGEGQ